MTERTVSCTSHAIDRLVERGQFQGWPRNKIGGIVLREVENALAEGRIATKRPSFASWEGKRHNNKLRHEKWCRYAWNLEQTRCYVLKRTKEKIVVVSVNAK